MRDQKTFTYTHIRPLAHTTTSTRVAPGTGAVMFGRKNIVHGCLFSYILIFWSSQVLLNFQTGGLSCVLFRSPPLSITIMAIIRFSSSMPILLTAVVYPILFSRL